MAIHRGLCGQAGRLCGAWPALALMMLIGCGEESVPTEAVDLGSLRTYADLSVSRLIDGRGHLPSAELNRVARERREPGVLLDERRAQEFAQVAAHQFGPMLRGYLERGHGGPIDIAGLRVCGRSYFVESPFQPLPAEIAVPAKKQFGSWWVVGLCAPGGMTQVSIAVSVYASDLRVENGELRFPRIFGNEFKLVGVPRSWDGAIPVSPERAIVMAGKHSGRKVAAVPSLVGPDLRRAYPQAAAWRLALGTDRAPTQHARDDGEVLYVGVSGALVGMPGVDEPARLMAPARSSAVAERVPLPTTAALLAAGGRPTTDALVALVPRQDLPLHFASVGGN
jgi:hypothetical protein